MHTGRYWSPETKHTSGEGPGGRAYSALPMDWDSDGDLDLVIGVDNGKLYLRINEGTKTKPAFAVKVTAIRIGKGVASVPGGYAIPVAADWDGDGRVDLISGNKSGTVYWFRNTGDKKIELSAPQAIAGAAVKPTGKANSKPTKGPVFRTQVDVADFDGDGDLDLLVGDYDRSDGGRHGWVWLYRRVDSKASPVDTSAKKETHPAKK